MLPFSTPQTRESTLSDLPEAPAQGGRSTTVFGTRTPTHGPPHPALADASALESFFGGGGAGSVLLAVPSPSRLSPARQHSFSSAGLSPHNALGAAKRCGGHKERPMQHGAYPQERHPSEEPLM